LICPLLIIIKNNFSPSYSWTHKLEKPKDKKEKMLMNLVDGIVVSELLSKKKP
jgi:hypothetical protein